MHRSTAVILTGLILTGCATTAVSPRFTPPENLPGIAAQYVTTVTRVGHPGQMTYEWRALRDANRVEMHNLVMNTVEAWSRSVNDTLFYERIFRDDKRVVEYSPIDLNVLGVKRSWPTTALLLDPQWIPDLVPAKVTEALGRPAYRYVIEKDGGRVDLTWLVGESIPAVVRVKTPEHEIVTKLKEVHALAQSPWQLTNTEHYVVLDYSDLGDMERDPFVMKILASDGHHHH